MATEQPARTVHVEHCMGTVFSIDVRDEGDWGGAIAEVVTWLHHVDAVFSTYRDDSDISRWRRGELRLADADPELGAVLELCAQVQAETDGWFSARWRDGIDPTGLVKGWAIERASDLLRGRGSSNHAVNGGGDVQTAGSAAPHEPDRPWRIAVVDPLDRSRTCAVVSGTGVAVATSGTAERGQHIVNPYTGGPATGWASVTVVGRSLTRVDAYATAAFAMGSSAPAWIAAQQGYEALFVATDGTATPSAHFPGVLHAR